MTDDFEIGQKVMIVCPNDLCHGMTGTVVNRDAYTVEVRLDSITEEMMGYEDLRTGLANFYPNNLTKVFKG